MLHSSRMQISSRALLLAAVRSGRQKSRSADAKSRVVPAQKSQPASGYNKLLSLIGRFTQSYDMCCNYQVHFLIWKLNINSEDSRPW